MDLSVALIIAASFAILCTFYIGKRILTIDFSEYSSKNSKKAKLERLLAKKETPLQNSKIRRDMRTAFERILIPLGNADQDLLPARMDMAFRKKTVSQINRLHRNKLCRKIYVTDVVPIPKNNFETWSDDGREWRESVLMCSTLERFESTEDNKVQHEIYRKNSYLRILQSRHVRRTDQKENKKSYYHDMLRITCPSCGARVKLNSQQVTCEYCGAVIKNEFYDWQTESFEIYESISTNLKSFLQLLVSGSILFLCVFLCLYLIKDTEISLAAGVGDKAAATDGLTRARHVLARHRKVHVHAAEHRNDAAICHGILLVRRLCARHRPSTVRPRTSITLVHFDVDARLSLRQQQAFTGTGGYNECVLIILVIG